MKHFLLLLTLLITLNISAQGLIINEVSNGISGNQEYFELVVIGSQANPLGGVDLGGWIIDDNNGDFEGVMTGVGIAYGHIRITPGCLTSVKPGSIILIYNSNELSFVNDENDSNGDCIYIIPINSPCLENTYDLPTTSNSSYNPVIYNDPKIWDRISLANSGDAVQVRRPDGSFYHGFSYDGVTAPFPNFPIEFGGSSSFNISGSGGGSVYLFNCGNFTQSTNFTRASASSNETPGLPNNDANRYFINSLRNGTYDYSNLSNGTNCGSSATLDPCVTILPIELNYFRADIKNSKTILEWQTLSESNVLYFEIEKSFDGLDWLSIGKMECTNNSNISTYNLYDYNSNYQYYRLKFIDINGNIEILKVIFVENTINETILFSNEGLLVSDDFSSFEIYLLNGSIIDSGEIKNNLIRTDWLPYGSYIISIKSPTTTINKLYIK